jgi:hypothetical protein
MQRAEISAPAESAISRIIRIRLTTGVIALLWPLSLILATQAVVSLATLHNSAFQDEALYLYAGRQIFRHWLGGPAPLENYAFYFSGYPGVYPVLGGVLDRIGGLEVARGFSLVCMLGVNIIVYFNTRKFFGAPAAIFASATYACVGSVLFLGRLATFDALCLLLIALATGISFHVSTSRHAWLALLLGPLLVLSVLAKYAALLFVFPVLGILVFSSISFQGWRRMLLRVAIATASLVISLAVAYHLIDKSAFHAIVGSTTNRTAIVVIARQNLLLHVLQMGGVVYAAALLGVVIVFTHYPRLRLIAMLLFATSWLMPAYHIYKQEAVSIDKHIAYGLFFAIPLAGCALAWLSGNIQQAFSNASGRSWLIGLSAVLIVFCLGLKQSQAIYAQWADTSNLSYVLHTQMRDGAGRYLIEDIEVVRYDAKDVTEPWQWNGVQYFYYVTAEHQQLLSDPALAQAIKDRYFALVELSFNAHPAEALFIAQQMAASRNYDLIAKIQFQNSFGIGNFYIWRSAAVAGQGNFASVSHVIP